MATCLGILGISWRSCATILVRFATLIQHCHGCVSVVPCATGTQAFRLRLLERGSTEKIHIRTAHEMRKHDKTCKNRFPFPPFCNLICHISFLWRVLLFTHPPSLRTGLYLDFVTLQAEVAANKTTSFFSRASSLFLEPYTHFLSRTKCRPPPEARRFYRDEAI